MAAAAKKAQEEYKRSHPEVNDEDLAVDLPPQPAAGPSNVPGAAHAAALQRVIHPPPEPLYVGGMRRLHNAFLDVGAALELPPLPAMLPPFGGLRDAPGLPGAAEFNNALRALERGREQRQEMRRRIQQEADAIRQERRARQLALQL